MNPFSSVATFVLLGVAAHVHATPPGETARAAAGKEFSLHLQESAALSPGGASVLFAGYVDQRCPADVQCAVAGEARALLWVTGTGAAPSLITLDWTGSEAAPEGRRSSRTVGTTRITLLALEPRPRTQASANPTDYVVRFRAEPLRPSPRRKGK